MSCSPGLFAFIRRCHAVLYCSRAIDMSLTHYSFIIRRLTLQYLFQSNRSASLYHARVSTFYLFLVHVHRFPKESDALRFSPLTDNNITCMMNIQGSRKESHDFNYHGRYRLRHGVGKSAKLDSRYMYVM